MEFKNIVTKRVFTDKKGNEKVKWYVIGTLKTMNDGRQFIELFMFPGVSFYVFEQREKGQSPISQQNEPVEGVEF